MKFAEKIKVSLVIALSAITGAVIYHLIQLKPFLPGAQLGLHSRGGLLIEYGADSPGKGKAKEYVLMAPDEGCGITTTAFTRRVSPDRITHLYIQPSGMDGGFFRLKEGITVFLVSEEFIPDNEAKSDIFSICRVLHWPRTTDELMRSAGDFYEESKDMEALLDHLNNLMSETGGGDNG